jgi:hypothetical protein
MVLAPAVCFAPVFHVSAALAVVADSGEGGAIFIEDRRPKVQVDGLAGRPVEVLKAVQRHPAVRGAIVLTIGEDDIMGGEGEAGVFVTVREAQFGGHRIGLDIGAQGSGELFVPKIGGANDVEKSVAGPVQIIQLPFAKSPTGTSAVGEAVGPLVGQADALHAGRDMVCGVGAVIRDLVASRIIGPHGIILDIPDIQPEPLQAPEPVEIQPGLATEGAPPHHAQNNYSC